LCGITSVTVFGGYEGLGKCGVIGEEEEEEN
jgi:hypothetical protein